MMNMARSPDKNHKIVSYDVTLWHVHLNNAAVDTQQLIMYIVDLHVTVNHIKLLIAAQRCSYGKFMLPATIECIFDICLTVHH